MSKYCDVCSMHFQDEYALQGHLAGKKHLRRFEQFQAIKRSIVVSPLPKCIPPHELLNFLQLYGPIKWHRFGFNHLIVQFCDRSSSEILLSNPVWMNNIKLNVKKRIVHNNLKTPKLVNQNNPTEDTGPINYDNIKHIFEEETIFDNQLSAFLNAVQLTDAEIETRYECICIQLDKIFKVIFPKCKTYRFGSTQTGLGFKGCDLDIYMDIGEPINESKSTATDSWTMQKIFREVKGVMFRMNCAFSNIISIPKAKTPIIKFCYIRTNVSCDISFKNSLGIHKSYLIKYCISLDSRLKPLMILIKYWARHFEISGSWKISNYALVLLIIFYLQQPSVNIIPPLMALQNTCQPQIINGWQVNFDENAVLPPITNKNSIPQLLHGFFFFYATFQFKSAIICPINGMVHTESEFKEFENLPPCMNRYKAIVKEDENLKLNVNKLMCVQDPIELNHNVIPSQQPSALDCFVNYCAVGAEICAMTSNNDYKDLLKTLFVTLVKKKVSEDTFKVAISANQTQCINELNNLDTSTDSKVIKSVWSSTIFNIIKDIFEKVFKVHVDVLPIDVGAKQQKVEVLSDVHIEKQQKIVFHCTGSHCVWRKRKVNNVVSDPSLSCLEKEALISERTIKNCDKEQVVKRINLDVMCTFEKKHPLEVILTVRNENSNNHVFKEFACFAKHKLGNIMKRTLMHMQQFDKHHSYVYNVHTD